MSQFMNRRALRSAFILAAAPFIAPGAGAQGADLIVGDITGSSAYVSAGSPKAYSLGITLCNTGDTPANYDPTTGSHPVVTQNLYRLQNGRFVQIGQAWAAHLLAGAVQQSLCGTCTPWGDLSRLGAGCSSADSAAAMGVQANYGAKSEINAAAGAIAWPRINSGSGSGAAFKRLQVDIADLQPGPLYFVSAMVVASDDGRSNNELNNQSYRMVNVNFAAPSMPLSVTRTTVRGAPALQAWHDNANGPNEPDPSITLTPVDVFFDGRFWVSSKATPIAGGWHYEYAVQNFNSFRGAGGFTVPVRTGGTATNPGFHDVAYHSGEPYDGSDWVVSTTDNSITWACPQTYQQNPDANALRWDTIYNFWLDSDQPPATGNVRIALFRPGNFSTDPLAVFGAAVVPGAPCGSADFNCDRDSGTDADIEAFFACLAGNCPPAPCTSSADFNGDGDVGTDADIEAFFRVLGGGAC
jgi:hypothetical protein